MNFRFNSFLGRPPSWTFGADGCFFGPSGGGGQPTGAGALLSSTLRIAPEPYELVNTLFNFLKYIQLNKFKLIINKSENSINFFKKIGYI
jgi:hypothetical protein